MTTHIHIDVQGGMLWFGPDAIKCRATADGCVQVDGGCVLRPLSFRQRCRLVRLAAEAEDPEKELAGGVLLASSLQVMARQTQDEVIALALAGAAEDGPSFEETLAAAARNTGRSADDLLDWPARTVDALAKSERGSPWNRILFAPSQEPVDWQTIRHELCVRLLGRIEVQQIRDEHRAEPAHHRKPKPPPRLQSAPRQLPRETPATESGRHRPPRVALHDERSASYPAPAPTLVDVRRAPRLRRPSQATISSPRHSVRGLYGIDDEPGASTARTEARTSGQGLPESCAPPGQPVSSSASSVLPLELEGRHGLAAPVESGFDRAARRPYPPERRTGGGPTPVRAFRPSAAHLESLIGEILHHEADLRGID